VDLEICSHECIKELDFKFDVSLHDHVGRMKSIRFIGVASGTFAVPLMLLVIFIPSYISRSKLFCLEFQRKYFSLPVSEIHCCCCPRPLRHVPLLPWPVPCPFLHTGGVPTATPMMDKCLTTKHTFPLN